MPFGRLVSIAGSLVVASAVVAPIANAQDASLACGSFDLVGGDKATNIVDHPPEGNSPGDVRIGYRELQDGDGNSVGEIYFVNTLLRLGEQGDHLFAGDILFFFPDGVVTGTVTFQRPNVIDQSTPALTVIISGGSGAYERASGTVEVGSGDTPGFAFRLVCD